VADVLNKLTLALALIWAFSGCTRMVRPEGVSADAVFLSGGKVGWWQECTPAKVGHTVHCRIWNGAGLTLEDEDFLPYDGGLAPTAEELKIARDPVFPGPDRIFLANGRILLPRSRL
jgi:hypothetical protein